MDNREMIARIRELAAECSRVADDPEEDFNWELANRGGRFLDSLADELETYADRPSPSSATIDALAGRVSRG